MGGAPYSGWPASITTIDLSQFVMNVSTQSATSLNNIIAFSRVNLIDTRSETALVIDSYRCAVAEFSYSTFNISSVGYVPCVESSRPVVNAGNSLVGGGSDAFIGVSPTSSTCFVQVSSEASYYPVHAVPPVLLDWQYDVASMTAIPASAVSESVSSGKPTYLVLSGGSAVAISFAALHQ
jgi:hypothetical protein